MRGHDAHDVLVFADGAGAHGVAARAQPLRIAQEAAQRAALRLHIRPGTGDEQVQIGLPGRAAGERARLRDEARLGIDALDQRVRAHMARAQPPAGQPRIERAQLLCQRVVHLLAVAAHGLVIGHARIRRVNADVGQLVVAQARGRAAQARQQRRVLRAVVDRREQRHHRADLRDVEVALARIAEGRDALLLQDVRRQRSAAARDAHENRHVAIAQRALATGFGVVKRRADQRTDALARDQRLPLDRRQLALAVRAVAVLQLVLLVLVRLRVGRAVLRLIEDVQLDGRVVLAHGQARNQPLARIIADLRHVRAHDPPEHRIDGFQHVGAGAEVALQVNPAAQRRIVRVPARRLVKEQRRLGLAEAVDALLDIADAEPPVLPREAAENRLLNRA